MHVVGTAVLHIENGRANLHGALARLIADHVIALVRAEFGDRSEHSGGAAGQGGGARDEALPWTLAAEDDVIGQALQVWQQQAEGLGADKG